jgi:hypothetical protein
MFKVQNGEPVMDQQTKKELLLSYTNSEVDALLAAYEKYKSLASQIASDVVPANAPKFTFGSNQGAMQNLDPKRELKRELEKVGEGMKFQNPLIWLRYKYLAYANEPGKSISTLEDLIRHCEVDGICHRRFDAINLYLRRKYSGKDMVSSAFMDRRIGLDEVGQDPRFIDMCLDQEFMGTWSNYENSQSGKWREYQLSSPSHDCEVNCTC